MRCLRDPRVLWAKAILFVVAGMLAFGLILFEAPSVRNALLLGIMIWCPCRAYYFAFYVLERYIDPGLRFSGLLAMARHGMTRRWSDRVS